MNIKLDIPANFFNGEERSGYYVRPEMKKVWAVELDLLNEFARVCEKHGLKWWASGGTLLGAARHKGFIPWDDDVDICMMRSDYERLREIAESEFKHPYHLSTEQVDLERFLYFSKLSNEDTSMFEPQAIKTMNMGRIPTYSNGIYIDIFPLDNIPDDERDSMNLFRKVYSLSRKIAFYRKMEVYYPALTKWKRPFKATLHFIVKLLRINLPYQEKLRELQNIIEDATHNDSKRVAELCWATWFRAEKDNFFMRRIYERSVFRETIKLPFEMMRVPVMSKYDEILRQLYGDWRKFAIYPHHGSFYDTECSYKYYFENGLPSEVKI